MRPYAAWYLKVLKWQPLWIILSKQSVNRLSTSLVQPNSAKYVYQDMWIRVLLSKCLCRSLCYRQLCCLHFKLCVRLATYVNQLLISCTLFFPGYHLFSILFCLYFHSPVFCSVPFSVCVLGVLNTESFHQVWCYCQNSHWSVWLPLVRDFTGIQLLTQEWKSYMTTYS